jgi:AcrR family transcriptional regulator
MPRAGLTPESVVDAAAAIADADGLEAVTLARLAATLKVRTPSLYVHVASLEDLRHRLAVRGARELADALQEEAAGKARTDALYAIAAAYREYAREHPGTYAALQRADYVAGVADADRAVRVLVAVLGGYGIDGDEAIHATRAVRAALHGFAALESQGGFGMRQDVDRSFAYMVDALDRGLQGAKTASSGVGGVP